MMIVNLIYVAAFWGVYFTVLTIIYLLKEKIAWQPEPFDILDQPPFDCRQCLTVWTLVGSYLSIAVIISSFWFGFCGLLLSLGEFLALKYKEKHMVYED